MRFFTERDGRLFLNNHRVVVRSAINFGFYPYTVAYPSPELAEKEVRAAKALGLNMLSCHRTACTPALLQAADSDGLMTYEEPGGAPRERPPEPQSPAEAFERQAFLEKLQRLVVRDRNHPALVWWNMANEAFHDKVDDPQHLNPYIDEMMRTTHRLDPSRFVTYTSGKQSTVMFRPFAADYGLIYDGHTVLNLAGGLAGCPDDRTLFVSRAAAARGFLQRGEPESGFPGRFTEAWRRVCQGARGFV